jgi:CRISPR/Cas system type I-B associated protein Csh2 (Cas7 group RAMP superfamily)
MGKIWAGNYSCNADDSEKIQSAIIAFIENDSKGASKGASMSSLRCLSSYASVVVHYAQANFDDQVGYLQKINGQWSVLGLATGFDEEIMSKIPEPLQQ